MKDTQSGVARSKPIMLHQNIFKGFILVLIGLFLFACMDATTKYLTEHHNVPFVVAMRYIIQCSIMFVILAPRHSNHLIRTQRTGLVVVRSLALCCASLFVGLALQRMPVAETTAITFLAPMLVVLLSPFLGEKINGIGWIAAIMGFVGVLFIARPGSGLDLAGIVFALLAVCANTVYQLLSRVLASTEKAITLLFYTAIIGSICFGITLPWYWENTRPSNLDLVLFLVVGISGGLGHYLFTLAYRYAPASALSPMLYLQLLWAGLLGWIIFDTTPDGLSILGMIIIAASGLMIALKSNFSKTNEIKTNNLPE
jgi:drug/metabolite transporter (DMT)-like permease